MYKYALLQIGILLTTQVAVADEFSPSIATRCSPKIGLFELTAVVDANSGAVGSVPLRKGFSLVEAGKHELICKLGKSITAKTTVRVYGADNGMCMGSGQIIIDNLAIGKLSIIKDQSFNWHCFTDPVRTDISVQYIEDKVILKECMAETWEWGQGFINVKCKSRVVR